MNFNKPMIDLVREIRRRAPSDSKPGIKLANPELLHDLLPIHENCGDTVTKTLIKELYEMAGDPWPQALEAEEVPEERFVTKVYRGQTQLIPVANDKPKPVSKPQRMYRGQPVAG